MNFKLIEILFIKENNNQAKIYYLVHVNKYNKLIKMSKKIQISIQYLLLINFFEFYQKQIKI